MTDLSSSYLRLFFHSKIGPLHGLAEAFESKSLKSDPAEKVQKLWLCGTGVTSLEILDTPGGLQWTMEKG